MDVMEGWHLITCLENSIIASLLWSVAYRIAEVSSTVEEPNFSLPIIKDRYKSSKICLIWLDRRERIFFFDNP